MPLSNGGSGGAGRGSYNLFMSAPPDSPRWPWYLTGGFGIGLAVSGAIAAVYALVQGTGLFVLLPMAISIAGVLIYYGSFILMSRWEESQIDVTGPVQTSTPQRLDSGEANPHRH
jgi:hypothetical protein